MQLTLFLIIAGVACLAVSAFLLFKMVPREGAPPMTDTAETALALGQFSLMVFGLALIAKGVF